MEQLIELIQATPLQEAPGDAAVTTQMEGGASGESQSTTSLVTLPCLDSPITPINVSTMPVVTGHSTPQDISSSPKKGKNGAIVLPDETLRAFAKKGAVQFGSKSTQKEYEAIFNEYKEYSTQVYGDEEMNLERVFNYFTYHANRGLRSHNSRYATDISLAPGKNGKPRRRAKRVGFSLNEYNEVMSALSKRSPDEDEKVTSNRLQCLDKHYAAILRHCPDSLRPEIRNHQGIKDCITYVTSRKKTADSKEFKEKNNPTLEKFQYPMIATKCERYFWDRHRYAKSWDWITSSLRNRYTLSTTVQTLARHESCVKCKLSNFQYTHIKKNGEIDGYDVLFRNINVGKTNQADSPSSRVIQAKSIRHLNVNKCEQGALAMYLFTRFTTTDEQFDLTKNKNWYNIMTTCPTKMDIIPKELEDPMEDETTPFKYPDDIEEMETNELYDGLYETPEDAEKNEKQIGKTTYGVALKEAFSAIGEDPSHVCHFGRGAGPIILEFEDVLLCYIKQLGNWQMQVYERHYSSRLPFQALRAAAGCNKDVGFYYLPRAHIKPPQELKKKVFPNVERARCHFYKMPDLQRKRKKTAMNFLKVMDHLATVFLQDACAIMLDPERSSHNLFSHRLFFDPLFIAYKEKFDREYARLTLPENDPTFDSLKTQVPVIGHHLHNMHYHMARHTTMLSTHSEAFLDLCDRLDRLEQRRQLEQSHWGYVADAAFQAHQHSPYRRGKESPRIETNVSPGDRRLYARAAQIEAEKGRPSPSPDMMEVTTPKTTETETTTTTTGSLFPHFVDRINTLKGIFNIWNGTAHSLYDEFGGLKELYNVKEFRKKHNPAQLKCMQRIKYINTFIDWRLETVTLPECLQEIHDAFKQTKKTSITVAGTNNVVRDVLQWTGKRPS